MLTAFFFFFYNSYFALVDMFFIADELTKVLTTELMVFCGSNFMT